MVTFTSISFLRTPVSDDGSYPAWHSPGERWLTQRIGSTATDPIVVPTDETPAIQVGGGEEPDGMAGNTGRCGRMIVYTEA